MNQPRTALLDSLEKLIERECWAHEAYVEVLELERSEIISGTPEKVAAYAASRAKICEDLATLKDQRERMVFEFSEVEEIRPLSRVVAEKCSLPEQKRFRPLIARLRIAATNSKTKSEEYSQVVHFSLGLVSSVLSLMWSATEGVQKLYTAQGVAKNAYHPSGARSALILTEA
jgi:hypothetical protein